MVAVPHLSSLQRLLHRDMQDKIRMDRHRDFANARAAADEAVARKGLYSKDYFGRDVTAATSKPPVGEVERDGCSEASACPGAQTGGSRLSESHGNNDEEAVHEPRQVRSEDSAPGGHRPGGRASDLELLESRPGGDGGRDRADGCGRGVDGVRQTAPVLPGRGDAPLTSPTTGDAAGGGSEEDVAPQGLAAGPLPMRPHNVNAPATSQRPGARPARSDLMSSETVSDLPALHVVEEMPAAQGFPLYDPNGETVGHMSAVENASDHGTVSLTTSLWAGGGAAQATGVLSPMQARELAGMLMHKADLAEGVTKAAA